MANDTNNFGSASVNVEQPDTSINPNTKLEDSIIAGNLNYSGSNPYWLQNKLINDPAEFDRIAQGMFDSSLTFGERQQLQADPEKAQESFNTFKNFLRSDLESHAYVGEPFDQTLINHSVGVFSGYEEDNIPVDEFTKTILANEDKYKEMGVITSSGSVIPNLSTKLKTDEALLGTILSDRYQEYQQELGQRHNTVTPFNNDPNKLTYGWVAYNYYGGQGLTQYVNELQGIETDTETETQEETKFFDTPDASGNTGEDYARDFIANPSIGSDVPYRDLFVQYGSKRGIDSSLLAAIAKQESAFKPDSVSSAGAAGLMQLMPETAADYGLTPEERFDPEKNIDAATKHIARLQKAYPDDDMEMLLARYNAGEGNVTNAIAQAEREGGNWKDYLPMPEETLPYIEKVAKNYNEYGESQPITFRPITPSQSLTTNIPKDLNGYTDQVAYTFDANDFLVNDDDKILSIIDERFMPEQYKGLSSTASIRNIEDHSRVAGSLFKAAVEEDGLTVDELIDTVLTTAGSANMVDGNPEYYVNYDGMTTHQKLAFDALQFHPEVSKMFKHEGSNNYTFMPQRREATLGWLKDVQDLLFATETVFERQPDGTIAEETVGRKNFFSQLWNGAMTVGMGGAHMMGQYFFEPAVRMTNRLGEAMGFDVEASKEFEDELRNIYSIPMSEWTDREGYGALPATIGEAAPFIQYLGAMYMGGRALLGGSAALMQQATGGKKALDAVRLGQAMGGSARINAMGLKLSNALAKKQPWATGFGVFYSGGAAIEATQPTENSFYNIIPQLVGASPANDVSMLYNQAGSATKVAMDIAGSLTVDFLFDSIIAGTRFFGSHAAKKYFGKESFNSMTWDEAAGHFKVSDDIQFKHDAVEFWHNLTRDLARLPQGTVGESMAKDFLSGKESIDTIHDFARSFAQNAGEFANGFKNEIRIHVNNVQKALGDGVELSKEELDKLVEDQYKSYIKAVTDQTYNTLKNADQTDPDTFVYRFIAALEEQHPTTRQYKELGDDVSVDEVAKLREDGYNVQVKNGKVFVVDGNWWTLDLAEQLRVKAAKTNAQKVIDRKVAEESIPVNKQMDTDQNKRYQEITEEAKRVVGTLYRNKDGRLGYVIDFDDKTYTIQTALGKQQKISKNSTVVSAEEQQQLLMQNLSNKAARLQIQSGRSLSIEMKPPVEEPRPLALPPHVINLPPELRSFPTPRDPEVPLLAPPKGFVEPRNRKLLPARGETPVRGEGEIPLTPDARAMPSADQPKQLPAPRYAQGVEGDISAVEANMLRGVDDIDNRIEYLLQRLRNLDTVVYDDALQRSQRQQLRDEITQLYDLKDERLKELSLFYQRNPELQSDRMQGLINSESMTTRPEIQMEGVPDETYRTLVHYSKTEGLTELDPVKEGTGVSGQAARGGITPDVPSTYFYLPDTYGERKVMSQSQKKYTVETPEGFRVYDMGADPDGIVSRSVDENNGVYDRNKALLAIKEAGYGGYRNSKSVDNIVGVFDRMKVADEVDVTPAERRSRLVTSTQRDGRQNEAFFTQKALEASSKIPYQPVLDIDMTTPVAKAYDTYSAGGNFTGHISKMIAGFAEKQIRVAEAIVANKKFKKFLDIGASEGGLVKTVASQRKDMKGVALDPNSQMKANFDSTPEVPNAKFDQRAWQASWQEADGTTVREFKTREKFDVINEDFSFQFMNNNRARQVAGVKGKLKKDGIFVTSEKFINTENYINNEVKKYDHQRKYFDQGALDEDLQGIVTGMSKDQVNDKAYEAILRENFEHVEEFWNAGNFKGYLASDSKAVLDKFKKDVGDLTSEFTDPLSQIRKNLPKGKNLEMIEKQVKLYLDEVEKLRKTDTQPPFCK